VGQLPLYLSTPTPLLHASHGLQLLDLSAEYDPRLWAVARRAGSHLDYTYITEEAHHEPHPNEKLVSLQAGDMVFTHCELLHSGTLNTSGAIRYFISAYFSHIGLPHRDTFETPTIEQIIADARQRNDRRTLRLFGINEGFYQRQQAAWQQLIDEDKSVLTEGIA